MKRVHRALQLRHHRHTAKLLPHKHTSYGALFLLMSVPILMLVLVGHMASASDYYVSATVPAPMPAGAPAITSPSNGANVSQDEVVVSGTCPTVTPAIVIAIYEGQLLLGSTPCTAAGSFSVPVSLSLGIHSIVATVKTITGETGQSSPAISFTRTSVSTQPSSSNSPSPSPTASLTPAGGSSTGSYGSQPLLNHLPAISTPISIIATEPFLVLDSNRVAIWKGKFSGGAAPYRIVVDWGDGTKSDYEVTDSEEQSFAHTYNTPSTYKIIISVLDSKGSFSMLYTTVITYALQSNTLLDASNEKVHPVVSFIQNNIVQVYIVTLSGLTFLWYIEHGRHIAGQLVKHAGGSGNHKPTARRRH